MRRLLRIAIVLLGLLVVVGAAAIAGLVYWAQQESSRVWLAGFLSEQLTEILAGRIEIERIDGNLWQHIEIVGLRVHYGDKEVLTAPTVRAHLHLTPAALLRLQLRIASVEITNAVVDAKLADDGSLDLVEAFLPIEAEDEEVEPQPGDMPITLVFDAIDLQDVQFRFGGLLDEPLELSGIQASAALGVGPAGVEVHVESLGGRLRIPGLPELNLRTSVGFDDRTEPATIAVGPLELGWGGSAVNLNAVLRDARGDFSNLHIDGRVEVERLRRRELSQLVEGWPLAAAVSGAIDVHGDLDVLHIAGTLAAGRDQVEMVGRLDLSGSAPYIDATVRSPGLNLATLVADAGLEGSVVATVRASGRLDQIDAIDASAELGISDLALDGRGLGAARVDARLHRGNASGRAELTGAAGTAFVAATAELGDPIRFAADAYLDDFNVAAVGVDGIATALNLSGRIEGTAGESGSTGNGTIYFARSIVAGVDLDAGVIRTSWAEDRIDIHEAKLGSGKARLTVDGSVDLREDAPSRIVAALVVPRLEFAATRSQIGGGGSLIADARLEGPIRTPTLHATAELKGLDTGSVSLALARIEADTSIDAEARATGLVSATIERVSQPLALDSIDARIDLSATNGAQGFALAIDAADGAFGPHRIALDGTVAASRTDVTLAELHIGSSIGSWALASPATLHLGAEGVRLTPLRIDSEHGAIQAQADIPKQGAIDVLIESRGIDLAFLTKHLPRSSRVLGTFEAAVRGQGTAAAPELDLRAAIEEIRVGSENRGRFTAVGRLADARATLDARFEQDESHWLRAIANLPIELSLLDPGDSSIAGPLDARIESPGLRLDVLRPFVGSEVRNLDGKLAADIAIAGPIDEPAITGTVALTEGKALLRPLRVTVEDFTLRATHAPGILRIDELSARSQRGRLGGSGYITLAAYVPDRFDLKLEARRWPAIRTDRFQAEIGANLTLSGDRLAPRLAGDMTVESAYLRPDLRFLDSSAGPAERDATILVIDSSRPSFELPPAPEEDSEALLLPERVAADIRLEIRRGTRVRHEMADIELSGSLRARQRPGRAPVITGEVRTVRGWVQIQGREFQLERGLVTFTGGPVGNPSLDVVARHRRSPYVVEAAISGTVEEPTLNLRSEPPLEQADILAVLLFGRPLSQLDEGEKSTLQQQALSVTTGYAAGVLGQAVTEALGLDSLGIDLRDVDFSGGRIGIGRYVTPNTYVSVTQDLADQRGRTVSVEYYLTPSWKIQTSTDSLGASGADIIWQTLY